VVKTVLAGDGSAAERLMRSHLQNLREELERLLLYVILPYAESGV